MTQLYAIIRKTLCHGAHTRSGHEISSGGRAGARAKRQLNSTMPSQPIIPETRELLGKLSSLLIEQHKLLLDRERDVYQKIHGPIAGPGPWLTLVIEDPHFAWLKQISGLVVAIDEALSPRSTADQFLADALIKQAREMMRPGEQGSEFQTRYYNAIQESPDIVILQCRIEQLINTAGMPSADT